MQNAQGVRHLGARQSVEDDLVSGSRALGILIVSFAELSLNHPLDDSAFLLSPNRERKALKVLRTLSRNGLRVLLLVDMLSNPTACSALR